MILGHTHYNSIEIAQSGEQRVEVRRTREDEPILRLDDVRLGDRLGRRNADLLHHLASERVGQPRLPLRQRPRERECRRGHGDRKSVV